eukprot:13633124-Ditylum_brightwellii.AAC.1
MAAKMIKVDPKGFTSTIWRRSGATTMANNGESAINLKRAGGWQSNKVVQGYIAQSEHIKTAQVGALEGVEKPILGPQVSSKKQKVEEKVVSNPTTKKDAGDGAASEGDDSCKPAEWE